MEELLKDIKTVKKNPEIIKVYNKRLAFRANEFH